MSNTQKLANTVTIVPFSLAFAQKLLTIYGSPLYVYQGEKLQQTINRISRAIPYPRTQFHFASVTNGNVALLQQFQRRGWGLHANTPGDIYLGLQAGFVPDQIVYTGSNLSRDEMTQVLNWGVTTLNLDSLAQLQLLSEIYQELQSSVAGLQRVIKLGLRLNLPEVVGDSRIGVQPQEFPAAVAIAAAAGLKLSGLHFYRGTGTNATQAFTEVMDAVIATGKQLPDWKYLDFGGGFGYPYRTGGAAFDWERFGSELTQRLNGIGGDIDLIIEPGRAAIAASGILLTRVISVKWQGNQQIVGTDTSIANLAVLSVHGGYRNIVSWPESGKIEHEKLSQCSFPLSKEKQLEHHAECELYPTDVCGNTTYSRDYLGKNCQLPALGIGEILAILDVGAYGYAMSSHFLHRPRPAEVLLENGSHRLIRQREDYSVLLNNQVF
ncbi:MAG: diaminopimelate decarboxylase family protein [Actinomycetota bacterium]